MSDQTYPGRAPAVESQAVAVRVFRGTEDANVAELFTQQLEYLANELARLEARLPTSEEADYLRKRKLEDDRASWAWQTIKTHAPWVTALLAMLGAVAYWVLTHTINVSTKP